MIAIIKVLFFNSCLIKYLNLQVLCICLCAWLIPPRLLPSLVNTALLTRQSRNAGGDVLRCIFLSRELILNDGFSRLTRQDIKSKLQSSLADLEYSIKLIRLGGDDLVHQGADSIDSSVMDSYNTVMYQVIRTQLSRKCFAKNVVLQPGCPWRVNPSNCSLVSRPQVRNTFSMTSNSDIIIIARLMW